MSERVLGRSLAVFAWGAAAFLNSKGASEKDTFTLVGEAVLMFGLLLLGSYYWEIANDAARPTSTPTEPAASDPE